MNTTLVLLPFFVYLGAITCDLLYQALLRRRTGAAISAREEALGPRGYGTLTIAMTLAASNLGPADTLALSEQGAKYGVFFLMFPLCAALQHIFSGFLFAGRLQEIQNENMTIGDVLFHSFGRGTQFLAGLVTVAQALAFTGVLALAGGQILNAFLGWSLPWAILATALFVAAYTGVGGMAAVVSSDRIQMGFLTFAGAIAGVAAISLLVSNTSIIEPEWLWNPDKTEFSVRMMLSLACGYFLGEALLPMYSIRAMMAASPSSAKRAFVIGGCFMAVWYATMIVVGISSHLLSEPQTGTSLLFVNVLASITSIAWLRSLLAGVAMVGLLALTHSTLDSVLNAGASSLAKDVLGAYVKLSDESLRSYMRSGVFIIAIIGTVFSIIKQDLIDILMIGYSVWVPTIVFPLGFVLVWSKTPKSKNSAVWGIAGGLVGYFVADRIPAFVLPPMLVGFIANAFAFVVSEYFAQPGKPDNVGAG
ncbi:MAG: sodium:solute symporter family protein [Planctomycetota bacterium]